MSIKNFQRHLLERNNVSIYCDMDGVLVDFHAGADAALKKAGYYTFESKLWESKHNDTKQEFRFEILNSIPNFWSTLPPKKDMKALWETIAPYKPSILSAIRPGDEFVREQKEIWISNHLPQSNISNIHIVYREDKQKFARLNEGLNILIDDYSMNIKEWEAAGGIGIDHKNSKDTTRKFNTLAKLLI